MGAPGRTAGQGSRERREQRESHSQIEIVVGIVQALLPTELDATKDGGISVSQGQPTARTGLTTIFPLPVSAFPPVRPCSAASTCAARGQRSSLRPCARALHPTHLIQHSDELVLAHPTPQLSSLCHPHQQLLDALGPLRPHQGNSAHWQGCQRLRSYLAPCPPQAISMPSSRQDPTGERALTSFPCLWRKDLAHDRPPCLLLLGVLLSRFLVASSTPSSAKLRTGWDPGGRTAAAAATAATAATAALQLGHSFLRRRG